MKLLIQLLGLIVIFNIHFQRVQIIGNRFLLIEAEVMYPSDDYHANDTTSVSFVNTPLIVVTNATPYLKF
jgi:hypothetical protein